MTSLNPVLTVGQQIGETLRLHQGHRPRATPRRTAVEMLTLVGIPDARAARRANIRTSSPAACASG